ncbi:MAG: C10 family peptidase, partial [candidate division Zixibacteria bacterium]|nr:C10 family peptidase [candidate division Zixibacteria bacterium]
MNLKTCTRLPIIILTVLFTAFLFAGHSAAETAAAEESELVCQNWLTNIVAQKGGWAGETNPQIIKVDELIENDTLLARIYTISPDGFIIVPILKDMAPVKFYTDEGRFDMDQRFGFPQMMREILQNRIRVYVETYGSLDAVQPPDGEVMFGREHRKQWDTYSVAKSSFSTSLGVDDLGPLLTSRWHQFEPYWNYCPYGDGDRCVVGCVATAAAQIFKYHQWPPEGSGSHSYWWNGDYSCEGSSPGLTLGAEFSDPYDWANIPNNCDGGCTEEQNNALAELNYEVAIAFDMDFGACGSGTWPIPSSYSTYFKYRDLVMYFYRSSYAASTWFSMIVDELNQYRPIMYLIESHAIVCDGWRISGELNQYHMNYGWGGSYNGWYTVDNLHCAVEGCSYLSESMQRFIIPDRRSVFTSSNNVGWVPLDVSFSGSSDLLSVDGWKWDFGDGDSALVQEPVHTYNIPGVFDVSLRVDSGTASYYYEKTNHVVALADTIRGIDVQGPLDSTLEIPVYVTNNVPLYRLQIPIEYDGPLTLKFKGLSTTGCRADYFDDVGYINYDANNKRFTLNMETGVQADLAPGTGPVVIIKFDILSGPGNETNPIVFDGYTSYEPKFYGELVQYTPILASGSITYFYVGCCIGQTGNVDCSALEEPDISDITRLIDYLYLSH